MAEKSQPDIASELWTNGLGAFWQDALDRGVVKTGGLSMNGGGEGFFLPTSMVEANPELATIEGVLANPQLFPHPEGKDMGAFYGCPAGWNCQITSTNLFNAFGFGEAGFEIIDPGSGAALGAAMAGAHDKETGIVGYYWGPTALLGLRDFTRVSVGDDEQWDADKWACITQEPNMDKTGADACDRTYYANATIEVAFTSEFEARAPKEVMDYLNNRTFSDKDIGALLDVVAQEAYSPEDAAIYMVLERQDLWKDMVSPEAAAKIIAAVK
jgi:glycine betaine/proline transport system substrate-binding protein